MNKTTHFYKVYTNNFGSPGKYVQSITLYRVNKDTVRVVSAKKISDIPASRFHVDKSTDALIYIPRPNHVGYILEEYFVK